MYPFYPTHHRVYPYYPTPVFYPQFTMFNQYGVYCNNFPISTPNINQQVYNLGYMVGLTQSTISNMIRY